MVTLNPSINIPKGYKLARYQGFPTSEEAIEFMQKNCNFCSLKKSCDDYQKVDIFTSNRMEFWDAAIFSRYTPVRNIDLLPIVICSEFKKK